MPKDSSASDAAPANKAVLAAGAVLWRASDDGAEPEVAVIHRPRYDDWSLPKGKVDVGESEPITAVREVARGDGLQRAPRQATDVGELSGRNARHQEGAVLGGTHRRRRVRAERRSRRIEVAARFGGDQAAPVRARPEGVAPVRQATRRHQDHLDRPARHRRQQVPVQRRRPVAPVGQARPRPGRIIGRSTAGVRRRPRSMRPIASAASRRSNRWPKNSASRFTTNRC